MKKVLVVDDDPAMLTIASIRLKSESVQTLIADNGADGLHMAREHRPDVIVLDLMMPKMHGYTLIQEIRNDPSLSHVKILVTSAKAYSSDVERTLRLGADRYLSKPLNLQEFWDTIAELLEEKRPPFTIRFWGTRGSIATPGQDTIKYGGNTACTEVRCGKQLLILDAGTGKGLLAQPQVVEELKEKGQVEGIGTPSVCWLGVTALRKLWQRVDDAAGAADRHIIRHAAGHPRPPAPCEAANPT